MADTLKLRAKMLEHGYTPTRLATEMGISERSLIAKMQNRTPFTLPDIKKICDIFAFTKKDLFTIFFN